MLESGVFGRLKIVIFFYVGLDTSKCCKVYGKDANRMVGELDMYSDLYLIDMKERGEL